MVNGKTKEQKDKQRRTQENKRSISTNATYDRRWTQVFLISIENESINSNSRRYNQSPTTRSNYPFGNPETTHMTTTEANGNPGGNSVLSSWYPINYYYSLTLLYYCIIYFSVMVNLARVCEFGKFVNILLFIFVR